MGINATTGAKESIGRDSSIAIGEGNTALNSSFAMGRHNKATGDVSTAFGVNSTASGQQSVAFGTNANVSGNFSYSMGSFSSVESNFSVGIGYQAHIYGAAGLSRNSTAVGGRLAVITNSHNASLFGSYSNINTSDYATAIGANNTITNAPRSGVLGTNNTVSGTDSYVMGNNVTLTTSGSVVLGNHSSGNEVVTAAPNATIDSFTYNASRFAGNDFTDRSGHYVSVGSKGAERRILHVGAGRINANSTDAINGCQLYLVAARVEEIANNSSNIVTGESKTEDGKAAPKTTTTYQDKNNPSQEVVKKDDGKFYYKGTNIVVQPENVITNVGDENKVATVGDITNTINNTGWKTTPTKVVDKNGNDITNTAGTTLVNPGDSVNYVNGNGTTANVTVVKGEDGQPDTVNVSYDVKAADNTITVNNDGVKVNTGESNVTNKGQATSATDKQGNPLTVTIDGSGNKVYTDKDGKNVDANNVVDNSTKIATVGDIVNTINNVFHTVNATNTGEAVTKQNGTTQVNAGDTLEFVAGKNLVVNQTGGRIVFATDNNVTFNHVNTTTLTVGNNVNGPKVDFKAEGATPTNVTNTQPDYALNISTNGKPTQITGVGSVLNTKNIDGIPQSNGTDKLLNLTNLPQNILNSVATVADLANMGCLSEREQLHQHGEKCR